MVIDGRALAATILAQVREEMQLQGKAPVVRAITSHPTKATESYLRIKAARAKDAGMELEVISLEADATLEDITQAVEAPGADAVIIQLPLGAHIDVQAACNAIPPSQDADVLSAAAYAAFAEGKEGALVPPVAEAVEAILIHAGVDPKGKRVAVVGQGKLVGKPAALLLSRLGGEVSVYGRNDDYRSHLIGADIVITGVGVPGVITPDLLKEGVVLIDAGTSESGGVVVGDVDPACASKASVFTPVPGGVGPVAVACLFRNVQKLLMTRNARSLGSME